MERNPQRMAWGVLLSSFATFCLLITGVPLGTRWFVLNAEQDREAVVESLVGTVVVEPPVGGGPVPLSKGASMSVPEGTSIYVDETSEAVITFFDHSFMRLFSGTTVRLERLRSPRFAASELPISIHLNLLAGRARIGTALPGNNALDFRVKTLYADTLLAGDGSYSVEVGNETTELASYRGQAWATAQGETVALQPRQRTDVPQGQAPQAPVGVARNLVANGDFQEPLKEWRIFNDQGTDGGEADGKAELVVDGGRRAVRLSRENAQGNHCETVLEQVIDTQLPDPATSLVVRATVKVRNQGLSGGGYLASEYPLMIRITYRDVYDSEAEWVQGFYYQNDDNNPTTFGQQIPQDRWFLYESENLLESLPVSPYRIIKIRVYAAGWDYESLISDINLIVE